MKNTNFVQIDGEGSVCIKLSVTVYLICIKIPFSLFVYKQYSQFVYSTLFVSLV